MRLVVLCLGVLVSGVLAAQPPRALAPPDARLSHEFSFISSVRELADGRILVTDGRESRVVVADLTTNAVRDVGRRGAGPREYASALPLSRLPADSSLMGGAARRWLVFVGDAPTGSIPPDTPALIATRGLVSATDDLGHVWSTWSPPSPLGSHQYGATDSIRVLRVARATGRVDTVARLRAAPGRVERWSTASGSTGMQVRERPALATSEVFAVAADGWLAVARLEPYRVDWRTPDGRWIMGRAIADEPQRVTRADQNAYVERQAFLYGTPRRPAESYGTWPKVLPPFVSFAEPIPGVALATPDGLVLILRMRSARNPGTCYDMIDRRGVRTGRLCTPPTARVIGFGRRHAYVVTRDADGLESLARHPWAIRAGA